IAKPQQTPWAFLTSKKTKAAAARGAPSPNAVAANLSARPAIPLSAVLTASITNRLAWRSLPRLVLRYIASGRESVTFPPQSKFCQYTVVGKDAAPDGRS